MWLLFAVIMAGSGAASLWVYACRGRLRFASVREYVRKGWPPFALPNCILYACTPEWARGPVVDLRHFPQLEPLCAAWPSIRDEALALAHAGVFEATRDPGSPAWFDLGFRTLQRRGWSKFYLRWYGTTQPSAARLCPRTLALLAATPGVNGALFTRLPAGARITRHLDPLACSLRLHLGLSTPNDPRCSIEVDGELHTWRDGEGFVFDETYLHHARNDTERDRIILMCDLERPLNLPGRILNRLLRALVAHTVVPNLPGDHRGIVNRVFTWVAPVLGRLRRLKPHHPAAYRLGKVLFNTLLVVGLLIGLDALLSVTTQLVGQVAGVVL